jgi:hypothetical protein
MDSRGDAGNRRRYRAVVLDNRWSACGRACPCNQAPLLRRSRSGGSPEPLLVRTWLRCGDDTGRRCPGGAEGYQRRHTITAIRFRRASRCRRHPRPADECLKTSTESVGVAEDAEVQHWLAGLPRPKRQPNWSSPPRAGTESAPQRRTKLCARPCCVTTARSARRSWSGRRRPTRSAGWPRSSRRSRAWRPIVPSGCSRRLEQALEIARRDPPAIRRGDLLQELPGRLLRRWRNSPKRASSWCSTPQ